MVILDTFFPEKRVLKPQDFQFKDRKLFHHPKQSDK